PEDFPSKLVAGNASQPPPPSPPTRRSPPPMTDSHNPGVTRRELLQTAGTVAAASALAGVAIPAVHAAEDNTIRIALVGCGGRGTGAVGDALSTRQGPIKLVAMADVFKDRLDNSYDELKKAYGNKIEVGCDHK